MKGEGVGGRFCDALKIKYLKDTSSVPPVDANRCNLEESTCNIFHKFKEIKLYFKMRPLSSIISLRVTDLIFVIQKMRDASLDSYCYH